jgi:hypothetical protein
MIIRETIQVVIISKRFILLKFRKLYRTGVITNHNIILITKQWQTVENCKEYDVVPHLPAYKV